jgi:hypothetical protein
VTLTFDRDIDGFSSQNIQLISNGTGAVPGSLTKTGTGVYSLAISGITNAGVPEIRVSKAGYDINPASRTVAIHHAYSAAITITLQNEWDLLEQTQAIAKNTSAVFTTNGNYASCQWYLDGMPAGTGASYTFNEQGTLAGDVYELVVVAGNADGDKRSGRCLITITN